MESYLNVRWKESVVQKVIQVWGSAFTTRAIAFRLEKGMAMDKAPIGIAVLKMVEAKSAGVVLTVLPTIGDTSKVVVEGNWGLGESVVSGEINPDQFIIDKDSGNVESTINQKTKMVVYQDSGTITVDIPVETQNKPCVETEELKEIVRIAERGGGPFSSPPRISNGSWIVRNPFPKIYIGSRPVRLNTPRSKKKRPNIWLS